jgi:excisionase family DNA binding protein
VQKNLTVSDAAREANVLPAYLYQLLTAGKLTGIKIDGKWSLNRENFNRWLASHRSNRRREKR